MSCSKFKIGDSVLVQKVDLLPFQQTKTTKGLEKENLPVTYLSCTHCDKIYRKRNSFNYHMRSKHGVYASKSLQAVKEKASVKQSISDESRNKLSSNKKGVPSPVWKSVVQEVHDDSHNYQCDKCEKSYKVAFSLKRHVEKHHLEKQSFRKKIVNPTSLLKFKCKQCPVTFLSEISRDKHTNSHKCPVKQVQREDPSPAPPDASFRCDLCPLVFTSKDRSNIHFQAVHLPVIQEVFAKKVKQKDHQLLPKFKCTLCQKKFMFKKSLKVHIETHSEKSQNLSLFSNADDILESTADTADCIESNSDNNSLKNITSCCTESAKSTSKDLQENDTVLQLSPLIIFQEKMPVKTKHARFSVNKSREIINKVIDNIFDNVVAVVIQVSGGRKTDLFLKPILLGPHPLCSDPSLKKDLRNKEDAGNEAVSSNLDTSTDNSQLSEDWAAVRSTPSLNRTRKPPRSISCSTKTTFIMKETAPSTKNKFKKADLSIKIPNCLSPTSSPVATSSPKLSNCYSPLVPGEADGGKLTPIPHHSSLTNTASNVPEYSPARELHHLPPPIRGIHPLLLPLYTKNSPPTHSSSHSDQRHGCSNSTRNINNLISVFIHGRDGFQDTTAGNIGREQEESEKDQAKDGKTRDDDWDT